MTKTLIVLNPRAGSGRAGRLWKDLEPLLFEKLGELVVAITERPGDVAQHLEQAYASGLTRVISIGGDGTNHCLVNALANLNERHPEGPRMVYGIVPIGTGSDWARATNIPTKDYRATAEWIAKAEPRPVDLGLVQYDDKREYFLNITSLGMGGDVASRVNRAPVRRPWTFLQATVATLLRYQPPPIQVTIDGEEWYDERAFALVVANGNYFGHGMKIAPDAKHDDGLFDVLVIDKASRISLLAALQQVYKGTHLTHPAVRHTQGKEVKVHCPAGAIGMELDGEYASGSEITLTVRPGALHMLV
jgi:diacylglycerol kinase (ATP)